MPAYKLSGAVYRRAWTRQHGPACQVSREILAQSRRGAVAARWLLTDRHADDVLQIAAQPTVVDTGRYRLTLANRAIERHGRARVRILRANAGKHLVKN